MLCGAKFDSDSVSYADYIENLNVKDELLSLLGAKLEPVVIHKKDSVSCPDIWKNGIVEMLDTLVELYYEKKHMGMLKDAGPKRWEEYGCGDIKGLESGMDATSDAHQGCARYHTIQFLLKSCKLYCIFENQKIRIVQLYNSNTVQPG